MTSPKPESNHDHAQRSSIAATRIMQRLRIGRQQTQQAADAIAWHMTSFPPSEEALRLFVACLGGDVPRARRALLLQRADASGHGPKGDAREKEVDEELAMLDALEYSGKPLGAKQLALSAERLQTWEIFMVRKSANPRCAACRGRRRRGRKHPRGAAFSPEFRDRKRRRTNFSKKVCKSS